MACDVETGTIQAAAEPSFEHAHALRVLFEAGKPNSAAAMLRLQYETLLRAGWLLYGATDTRLAKASALLTTKAAQAAKNLRSADDIAAGPRACIAGHAGTSGTGAAPA